MTRAPLTVVTGEVGAGKTTLVQQLLSALAGEATIGLISNAQGGRGDLLHWVLYALGLPTTPQDDYISMFQRFQDFVIDEYAAGRHVILIIDEAQNLTMEALEELRMFTNINSGKDELLQMILVGQPELRDMVTSPQLRQFAQRVTATCHLKPLDMQETREYIEHRLRHVGGRGDEFSVFAMKAIYEETRGVPRLINKLCDMAMVYAASIERDGVGIDLIRELLDDGLFIKTREEGEEDGFLPDPGPAPQSGPGSASKPAVGSVRDSQQGSMRDSREDSIRDSIRSTDPGDVYVLHTPIKPGSGGPAAGPATGAAHTKGKAAE
jgi:type II secretory pathway predicted ATPase ExeA